MERTNGGVVTKDGEARPGALRAKPRDDQRAARSFDGFVSCAATCAATCAIGSVACQPTDANDLFAFRPAPAIEDLTVRTVDGRSFLGDAARIQITAPLPKGPEAVAEIALSTFDRTGQGISMVFEMSPDKLFDRAFTVNLGSGPGLGTLARLSTSGAEIISSGTLKLNATSGRVTGQFRTADKAFASGTIDGRYEVSCLVTPEMLAAEPNGQTSQGTWILVEDELKKTDFCRLFAEY